MRKLLCTVVCLSLTTMFLFDVKVSAEPLQDEKPLSEMTKAELSVRFDVQETAEEYGADPAELLDAIYEGVHSDRFSPFSELVCTKLKGEGPVVSYMKDGVRTFIAYDQDSTMYLETGNPCASGVYPYVGCVAVHRKSSTDKSPILPFGTTIHYEDNSANINGMNHETFTVEDTGDKNYIRSTYWTDVYGGANTTANKDMAKKYGVQKVTITWG